MKLGRLVLLGSALFFICGCNNKGGGDNPDPDDEVITIEDAREFINNKYNNHELKIPTLASSVSWNIEKDINNYEVKNCIT